MEKIFNPNHKDILEWVKKIFQMNDFHLKKLNYYTKKLAKWVVIN